LSLIHGPVTAFVALEPEPALAELIRQLKEQTRALVGDQLYLADSPHLTVYLSVFPTPAAVLDRWPKIAQRNDDLTIHLTGWHAFEADALTGNQTLACDIAAYDKKRLRPLQCEIIELLAPVRDAIAARERFAERTEFLTSEERRSVEQYGFPYVGDGWQPHLTIASVRSADWPAVWNTLEPLAPRGTFRCSRWRLFALIDQCLVALDGIGDRD